MSERADLVVIGAGPAGMAAAATAALGGLRVELIDAGHGLGGQYWRHPAPGADEAVVRDSRRYHHDLDSYDALTRTLTHLRSTGVVTYRPGHHVWTAERVERVAGVDGVEGVEGAEGAEGAEEQGGGFVVYAVDRSRVPERPATIRADRVLIAAGAFDRQLPFEGWDLPGVYGAGGLQALLKGHGVRAGSRVVIGGTGPFLLPVATGLAQAGARVVALCEASSGAGWPKHWRAALGVPAKVAEGAEYTAALARHRIPLRPSTAVVAARGDGRVEEATLARVRSDGRLVEKSQRTVSCDVIGVGWGFSPQTDLALTLGCERVIAPDGNEVVDVDDGQRTSVPGVSAAGEVCGVGGATLALREGQLAAEAILSDSGRAPVTADADLGRVRRIVAAHRAFAGAMHTAHPLPPRWAEHVGDGVTVCRCEEVSAGTVRAAVRAGASDARQVKQLTRAGMGWCQGRMCAPGVECLVRETHPSDRSDRSDRSDGGDAPLTIAASERIVAVPVPLGALLEQRDESSPTK